MKNILVAIDFRGKDHLLLNEAHKLASKFEAKVWFIHIAAPDPDFVGLKVGPQYIRDTRAEDLRKEHKMIQEYADKFTKEGIAADGLMVQGPTTDMIVNEAKKLNIDLIITGYQEHNFFYKVLYGSVTNHIIKASKIPIMVIPLDE